MYISPTELRSVLASDISDRITDAQLADAIRRADSIIDISISGRYAVPVAKVEDGEFTPHPIDFWASSIAQYLAVCVARGSNDFTDQDPIYRQYIATMSSISDIKNGIGSLPIPTSGSAGGGSTGAGAPVNQYSGNLFDVGDFDLQPSATGMERLGRNGGYCEGDYGYWNGGRLW